MLSKDNVYYPVFCPAIVFTKLYMFLKTKFLKVQSKLGLFSQSSVRGLPIDINLKIREAIKMKITIESVIMIIPDRAGEREWGDWRW